MVSHSAAALSPDGGWSISKSFNAGAGPWLTYKIGNAVQNMSAYSQAQIDHVKWLVTRNTVSISLSEDYPYKKDGINWSNMPAVIDKLFQMMIAPEDRRDTIDLNSNELVLIINSHGAWPMFDMRATTDEAVRQIREKWNYWPVRVYAGYDIQRSSGHKGLTLSLLNVCNTDLGGPSMIELLDAPVPEPGWHRLMIKKVYRERNYVSEYVHPDLLEWREQKKGYHPDVYLQTGDMDTPARKRRKSEASANVSPEVLHNQPILATANVNMIQTTVEAEDDTMPLDNKTSGLERDEEPDMFMTVKELPDPRIISHPTFDHSGGGGEHLIDLVGRHAKRFATPDSGIGIEEEPAIVTPANVIKLRRSSELADEEYEML